MSAARNTRTENVNDLDDALEAFVCATCDGRGRVAEGFQWPDPLCRACMGARYRADASPAEAVEVLATRDLWPWPVGDDASPRWWCERCDALARRRAGEDVPYPVTAQPSWQQCDGDGAMHPPTLAALVAVASLGCDTLRRAEGLALQLVGRAPRLTFRAVSRETLRAWTEERVYRDGDASLAYVAAHEALGAPSTSPLHYGHGETWSESFPWLGLSGGHVARRHWSMVRDLGLLGAMLVDLDGDRVTLAVEAI